MRIPAGSRTGDLITFRSNALRDFLTWRAGLDQRVSLILVASSRSSAEAVLHGTGHPDYQPPALLVAPNAETTFADWSASRFESPAERLPTADPDADGLPNLLEYALGSDPLSSGSASLPSVSLPPAPGSQLTLTFTPFRSDVSYIIQSSSNLTSWTDTILSPAALSPGQPFTFTDPTPVSENQRRFLRLKVTAP